MPWNSQRPHAVVNLIFQDMKRNITFFAAIMELASRSSAASQILKDLLATQFGGHNSLQNLTGDSHMPFGHRWHHAISQQEGKLLNPLPNFTI